MRHNRQAIAKQRFKLLAIIVLMICFNLPASVGFAQSLSRTYLFPRPTRNAGKLSEWHLFALY